VPSPPLDLEHRDDVRGPAAVPDPVRRASQGIFEILPRDAAPGISEESQIDKKVRVVSTIKYLLGP
jgi:hypothetical protein